MSFTGCKRDRISDGDGEQIISPTTGTRTQFTLDSIFLYAKQVYLWNDALPSYDQFSPRLKYGHLNPELTALREELFDISQLKINQATGAPFEASKNSGPKYSYIESGKNGLGTVKAGIVTNEMVLASNIVHTDEKNIGYIALGSFPPLSSSKYKLDEIFNNLALENTRHLIIDLRYNRGGFVETAEYVANLIAPSSLTGKVMYTEQFNFLLQKGKASILKHQPYLDKEGNAVIYKGRKATLEDVDYSETGNTYKFEKKGNLETIKDIYFIVSEQTASASELLISCLKPYFNVKLVGQRTFGKPVGFFGITVDQYTIYLSSFLIKNAQGWSNYFNGMSPDIYIESDTDLVLDNTNDLCLIAAISAITGNSEINKKTTYIRDPKKDLKISRSLSIQGNINIHGAIENRLKLK